MWLSEDYTRAAPGGTGEAKCGGNYAAAFAGQQQASRHGCDQVVWLERPSATVCRGDGRHEHLGSCHGSGARARMVTPAPIRLAPARNDPRLAPEARPRPGRSRLQEQDLGGRVA